MALRYAVAADLLRVLPPYLQTRLLDDDHDGTEDPGLADVIIEAAADEVDGYLSAAVSTPILDVPTPPTVKHCTLQIARYLTHLRLSKTSDFIEEQYVRTLDLLKAIVAGRASYGVDPLPAEASYMTSELSSAARVFSRDTLRLL